MTGVASRSGPGARSHRRGRLVWILPIAMAALAPGACAQDDRQPSEEMEKSLRLVPNAPGLWFLERFDNLNDGYLVPQDGWSLVSEGDDSPVVLRNPNAAQYFGKILKCKAPVGKRESASKGVANSQSNGRQYFAFWLRSNDGFPFSVASATKVMVEGSAGLLFQTYIGSDSMRVYASGQAHSEDIRRNVWYYLGCEFSLDPPRDLSCKITELGGKERVFPRLALPAGDLNRITLYSWPFLPGEDPPDVPGAITLDDMFGARL